MLRGRQGHTSRAVADRILPVAERIGADTTYAGRGVTIAFLDAGFFAHPDLMQPHPRVIAYHDVLTNAGDMEALAHPHPSAWHGTMTSVVCAGNGALSEGRYKGLAYESTLVFVKVGSIARIRHDDIALGLEWILAHAAALNIRVVNISCGGDYEASYLHDYLSRLTEAVVRAGVVVVCAAGNSGHEAQHPIFPPASAPAAITVGGVNDDGDPRRGRISTYHSSYGPTIDGLQKPELLAPAIWVAAPLLPGSSTAAEAALLHALDAAKDHELEHLLAQHAGQNAALDALRGCEPYLIRHAVAAQVHDQKVIDKHYKHVDGTSFAAPIVASVVARMLEANPALAPHQVKRILIATAQRLPNVAVERQGWGVVQTAEAVQLAVNPAGGTHAGVRDR